MVTRNAAAAGLSVSHDALSPKPMPHDAVHRGLSPDACQVPSPSRFTGPMTDPTCARCGRPIRSEDRPLATTEDVDAFIESCRIVPGTLGAQVEREVL